MKRFLALFVAAMIVFFAVAASAQSKPPLRLLQTIPLPDLKPGDFDHFAVDLAGNRLLVFIVAHNAEATIEKVLRRIPAALRTSDTEVLIIDDSSKRFTKK